MLSAGESSTSGDTQAGTNEAGWEVSQDSLTGQPGQPVATTGLEMGAEPAVVVLARQAMLGIIAASLAVGGTNGLAWTQSG